MAGDSSTPVSLAELKKGEHATLLEIHAEKSVTSRLTALGFTPGAEIEMTQNYGHGALVVMVRDTRFALGRQEAMDTIVKRCEA